jgi:hypothetical protein
LSNGLFDRLLADKTPEERAEYDQTIQALRENTGERPCPDGCGCIEFFDARSPANAWGSFGDAGCECQRCEGESDYPIRDF